MARAGNGVSVVVEGEVGEVVVGVDDAVVCVGGGEEAFETYVLAEDGEVVYFFRVAGVAFEAECVGISVGVVGAGGGFLI